MANTPDTLPQFGLYRPVAEIDLPAVRTVAERVGGVVSRYFNKQDIDIPVKVPDDFGVSFVPARNMQAQLESSGVEDFDLGQFAAAVRRNVKPAEIAPLPVLFSGSTRINGRTHRHPELTFVADRQFAHLERQRGLLTEVLEEAHIGCRVHSPDNVILVILGNSQHPVTTLKEAHRQHISRLSTEILLGSTLGGVRLDPLIIGNDYRHPVIEI